MDVHYGGEVMSQAASYNLWGGGGITLETDMWGFKRVRGTFIHSHEFQKKSD